MIQGAAEMSNNSIHFLFTYIFSENQRDCLTIGMFLGIALQLIQLYIHTV